MAFLGNLLDKVGSALHLPEFGLSEKFNNGTATANTYHPVGPTVTQPNINQNALAPLSAPTSSPSVGGLGSTRALGDTQVSNGVTGTGATFSGAAAPLSAYGPTPNQAIAPGEPGGDASILSQIDTEFNNHLASLQGEQNSVQGNADSSIGLVNSQNADANAQIDASGAAQRGDILNQQTNALDANGVQQGRQEAQLRQLLGDLQQRNTARNSVNGNGNSSVADASSEALGRSAFQGVGQVQDNRTAADANVRQQASTNLNALGDFIGKAKLNLAQNAQNAIQSITSDRDQKLAAIASDQNDAATAKSAKTLAAWQDYLSQKRSVDLSAFQSAQALATYQAQKSAALQEKLATAQVQSPNYNPLDGSFLGSFNKNTGTYAPAGTAPDQGGGAQYGSTASSNGTDPLEQQLQVAGL